MAEEPSPRSRIDLPQLATEGVLLAALPAFAYLVAYAYQAGFLSRYGVPREAARIAFGEVLVAGGAVGLVGFLFAPTLQLVIQARKKDSALWRELAALAVVWGLVGVTATAYEFRHVREWRAALLVATFITGIQLGLPLVFHRNVTGYANKLAAARAREDGVQTPFEWMASFFTPRSRLVLMTAGLIVLVANTLGDAAALTRRQYTVTNEAPPRAIVRIYGGHAVLVDMDRQGRRLGPHYWVVPLSDLNRTPLKTERLERYRLSGGD